MLLITFRRKPYNRPRGRNRATNPLPPSLEADRNAIISSAYQNILAPLAPEKTYLPIFLFFIAFLRNNFPENQFPEQFPQPLSGIISKPNTQIFALYCISKKPFF